MADNWRVEIRGLVEAQREADKTLRALHDPGMQAAMRTAVLLVLGAARKRAKVNTGRHRAHIVGDVRASGQNVEGVVGTNLVYAPDVIFGRKPGTMPPIDEIERWVWLNRAKFGGLSRKEVSGVAFRVAKKIKEKGTRGDFSIPKAYEENQGRVVNILASAVGRIVEGV